MIIGGGANTNTTVCSRCGRKLVWNTSRKSPVWTDVDADSMYCPFDGRLSPSSLAKNHKPVAGEPR
jgi:hypothetical protein